jgi:hypothetical protein
VLLSALSCSKKKDPEPVFEGTWDAISSVSTTYTNEQQKNQSTTIFPGRNGPNGNYMTVTSTTIQSYYNYGGSTGPITYYTGLATCYLLALSHRAVPRLCSSQALLSPN